MKPIAGPGGILVVVGMTREAKILGPDAPVLIGGGDAAALSATLEAELAAGVAGVVSFGLCGALDPSLKVGELVIGEVVFDGFDWIAAEPAWTDRLAAALPNARRGRFAHSERPVASVADKAALLATTGALAVDMESHLVARLARDYGAPFAVVRGVSDGAGRTLPHAAQVGLGADGRPAIGPVMASLRSNPFQIGALIRTALEAEDGFQALERARQVLGHRLAGPGKVDALVDHLAADPAAAIVNADHAHGAAPTVSQETLGSPLARPRV
jgi:hopanoid-associated phosphorylase